MSWFQSIRPGCWLNTLLGFTNHNLWEAGMGEAEQEMKQCDALELLYKDSIDNIRFYKQQQFTITNYAIALYVAITAISDKFHKTTDFEKRILSAVSIVVFIIGSAVIFRFHWGMVGC
jgi:hypothetical protein